MLMGFLLSNQVKICGFAPVILLGQDNDHQEEKTRKTSYKVVAVFTW
jgi:hypothetical protein